MVPIGLKIADIGTDHGYIPVYLALNGISKCVVASDIHSGSLSKAMKEISKYNLNSLIDARLGDGLNVLKENEIDVAIVAGMGGILISKILDNNKDIAASIKRFILQPMCDSDYLRKYLYKNKYKIVDEDIVRENEKFYEIIVAEHGKDKLEDEIFFEIGKKLFEKNHPLLSDFLKYKMCKLRKIANAVPESQNNISLKDSILNKIKKYEVLINEPKMPNNSWYD